MTTKTDKLITRVLAGRAAGRISNAVALCLLQDLWAGKTATTTSWLRSLAA